MATTMRAADFIGTLGVNTHLDFGNYGYQNLSAVDAAINYLGLKNIRDSPQWSGDVGSTGLWQQVANATGAKFDAYMPEGSPANMQASLNLIPQLASQGILNAIEGGNEEDDPYATQNGNNQWYAASLQGQTYSASGSTQIPYKWGSHRYHNTWQYTYPYSPYKNPYTTGVLNAHTPGVYQLGHSLGLPVINVSFGAGWTSQNNWQGDYGTVGDLSGYADYGNAHTYPTTTQTPDWAISRINGLAKLADSQDPVITTEIGWDRNQGYSEQTVAKFVLDATMDGIKDGDAKMYFYSLFDDGSGNFGLMNQGGTPMAAGTALHNLTTLLADTGSTAKTFATGSLGYTLSGTTSNDNSLLFQKSDGTYWISLWDEVDSSHNVTVTLGGAATNIKVFDPLSGTAATQNASGASSVTVNLTDHPLLVEVTPSSSTGSTPPPPTPSAHPNDLAVNVPSSGDTVVADTTSALADVSVSGPWAAQTSGYMALNLRDGSGAPLYVNGQQVTGTLYVTLDQLKADLAGLSYGAGSVGTDTVTVDVRNQAGIEATESFGVTIAANTTHSTSTITIAPTDANPAVLDSNVTIIASSGDHALFIGGTHDVAILTGGTETVQAYQGYNTITMGNLNDTIRIAGSGNVVDAGTGSNTIEDSGSANTLVMPAAGKDDVFGYVIQNGDTIDLRAALKATAWDGQQSTLGNFVHVGMSGNDAVITVSATANGATIGSMDLHDSGALLFSALLNQSIW